MLYSCFMKTTQKTTTAKEYFQDNSVLMRSDGVSVCKVTEIHKQNMWPTYAFLTSAFA